MRRVSSALRPATPFVARHLPAPYLAAPATIEHALWDAPAGAPAGAPTTDVEVSLRLYADGTRISVLRRTVADGDERRTVGIDAVIR